MPKYNKAPKFLDEDGKSLCWVFDSDNGFALKYWYVYFDSYDYGLAAIVSDY